MRYRQAAGLFALAAATAATLVACDRREGEKQEVAAAGSNAVDPFANSNGTTPQGYSGPLFQLSHAYPAQLAPALQSAPWRKAIGNGPITPENANAYVLALKAYVAPAMRQMLLDYSKWNAGAAGWYNEPWLGALREPIHGMYVGSDPLTTNQFPGTGLTKPFTTYVLTYYDQRAANALYNVWGTSAAQPTLTPSSGQFGIDSVVVKAAFTTANADVWPVMQGALTWPLNISVNSTTGCGSDLPNPCPFTVQNASFFQFDIIVKDPQAAPRTGWVFSTLVYDKDAPGADPWDKMVPLGAMWGNDPEVDSSQPNPPPLKENWINPAAPAYAKTTLGWGGRLSGPNDGALNNARIGSLTGPQVQNLDSSSCMGCHIAAQWPMKSFLLPTTANPPQADSQEYLVMWQPGSQQWMRWFQSPPGTQGMDSGTTPFDYDMVFAFKSLPAWQQATQNKGGMMTRRGTPLIAGTYNGLHRSSPVYDPANIR